jgi:hypothetical protein
MIEIEPPLTTPMVILLCAAYAADGRVPPGWYPAGQQRWIIQGLYDRGLIDEQRKITAEGLRVVGEIDKSAEWSGTLQAVRDEP